MPAFRSLLAATMMAGGLLAGNLYAQDVNPAGGETAESSATAKALSGPAASPASGPDIFLLPDESGKLRRVLGYRYEDFFKAWQADGTSLDEDARPEFVINSLEISAEEQLETLSAEITIEIELKDDGWVKVPLQLASLIIESSKIEDGEAGDFITFDARAAAYSAWLKGEAGDRRVVKLTGKLPLERDGTSRRLTLELPATPTSILTMRTSGEITLDAPSVGQLSKSDAEGGKWHTRIVGAKGKLIAGWGERASEGPGSTSELEAVVDAMVTVARGRLTYEAFIQLDNLGGPIDRVLVRLPPGATAPVAASGGGYSVRPLAGNARATEGEVEVVFDKPSADPPPIRITCEQPAAAGGSVLRIGSFEVLGAFRQSGRLAVQVSDELHAHFELDGQIQQIEPSSLPETLSPDQTFAAFQNAGTAWAAEVHTQPRRRKVTVEPNYNLHLGSQGATLDVALEYKVSGGPLFEFRLDLRGWELTEQAIESGGAVDVAEQHVTSDGVLILPLIEADLQQVRLRFSLRREAGLGVHDLPLPEAQEAFALPGELTVTCDEPWNATALIERSVGVSPIDLRVKAGANDERTSKGLSDRASPPLRLQTFLPQARVTVDVSERDQVIEVESIIEASIDGRSLRAEQQLQYDILYQPASQLGATVTADLLSNEGLELLLNGKPLPSTAVDVHPVGQGAAEDSGDSLRLVVTLPQPALGKVVLEIRSHFSLDQKQLSGTSTIELPLALPDQPARSTAAIRSLSSSLRAALANGGNLAAWTPTVEPVASLGEESPASLRVESTRPARELSLRLVPANIALPVETRIEAAWVQTWVAGGMRQDRIVYRFHTSGAQVAVALPRGFEMVEVLLNGRVAPVSRKRQGAIVINLPTQDADRSNTLELRRHTPLQIGAWGKQAVAFPRIEGADAWSPFFWQLVLPPDVAALATPLGMSAEYRLGWQGVRWGREPTQSQRDLERWTGATQAPTPGPRMNQYLYSAFEPPPEVEFVAVRRIWLVVVAGLTVFLIGLAWLYTSLARSAAFWLGLCVATGALLFVYPEAVIVLVQAVILGGAFTVLSTVTQWLLAGSRPRRAGASTAASSIASLAATQPWTAEAPLSSGATPPSAYHASGAAP